MVKAEYRESFIQEMLVDARESLSNESGCIRFDVLHDRKDQNIIWLYEVYKDDKALEAHRRTPHYLHWKKTVSEWLTSVARSECVTIYPESLNKYS